MNSVHDDVEAEPVMAEGSYDWWRIKVERLEADVQAALDERDQQFERKCEALRERDEARRERDEALRDVKWHCERAHRNHSRAVEYRQARDRAEKRAEEAEAKLHKVAMVKIWTNEDGKRFVFASDLAEIILDLSTETTTTPARETA